jgi:hypothetical protein
MQAMEERQTRAIQAVQQSANELVREGRSERKGSKERGRQRGRRSGTWKSKDVDRKEEKDERNVNDWNKSRRKELSGRERRRKKHSDSKWLPCVINRKQGSKICSLLLLLQF